MTLSDAQAAFRQSPNQSVALAYLDAAIAEWEGRRGWNVEFVECVCEIRDWLSIPQPKEFVSQMDRW
jgi:hypothetical protein